MNDTNTNEEKDYSELDQEDILEIKSIRAGIVREEEEEKPKKPDTIFTKVFKKVDHFWEYYKWLVIIPVIIIVIAVVFITTYIEENREVTLDVSIINATSILDTLAAIEDEYPAEYGINTKEKPIRLEYNLQFPSENENAATMDDSVVASMQKFNAMVLAGKVDVAITNTWVIDAYSENDATLDLREIFDEEFLEENADRIYWYEKYDGTVKPVAIYVNETEFLGEFAEGAPIVVTTFNTSVHKDETVRFIKWLVSKCEENK